MSRRSFSMASRTGRGCDAMKKDAKWDQSRDRSNWSRTQAQSPGPVVAARAEGADPVTERASAPPVTDSPAVRRNRRRSKGMGPPEELMARRLARKAVRFETKGPRTRPRWRGPSAALLRPEHPCEVKQGQASAPA